MWVAAAGQFAAAGLLLVSPVRKLRDFSGTSSAEEAVLQSGSERIS
jgi:hypothetical protein